jgi:hypothetical protein
MSSTTTMYTSAKASSTSAAPKVTGTVRSKNPLKGAVEIIPVSSHVCARDSVSRVCHSDMLFGLAYVFLFNFRSDCIMPL